MCDWGGYVAKLAADTGAVQWNVTINSFFSKTYGFSETYVQDFCNSPTTGIACSK
jgi:hypothetical protein